MKLMREVAMIREHAIRMLILGWYLDENHVPGVTVQAPRGGPLLPCAAVGSLH